MTGWSRLFPVFLGVLTIMVMLTGQVRAQANADELDQIRRDIESLKAGQKAIQGQLKTLIDALQAARAPRKEVSIAGVEMTIDGPLVMGSKDAKLVLVEFSDFQCPFCRRHLLQTMPSLKKDYIDTGKIRYVFRDYPIAQIHPASAGGHLAARCAADQDKYWAYHDRLFGAPKDMGREALTAHAKALEMDLDAFGKCLTDAKHANAVRADMAEGEKLGVRGTPTFFLGIVDAEDGRKIKLATAIRGAYPYGTFKRAIDKLLAPKEG
jgi:protein-disulfide isomerase